MIGLAAGAGGATLCLAMTYWFGLNLGGGIGIALAAILGLTSTLVSFLTCEELVRQHLAPGDETDPNFATNPVRADRRR